MTRRKIAPPSQLEMVVAAEVECAPAPLPSMPQAVVDVLDMPIRLLRSMPLPSMLVCSFAHEGGCVVLATGSLPTVPGDPPAPAFVGPEVDALALAAEHGRAVEATLRGWCARKPDWRLTRIEAIGKLGHAVEPLGWSTARVLGALGLRLDEVRL